jgi:hypothetical protein
MAAAPERSSTTPSARWRIPLELLLLLDAMLVAGAVSVLVLGQDANWDLQNYHFYNAWAFLHDRLGWDLAPAQLQSFHNPLLELPFYAMVAANWPPPAISFAMALPAGIGAFFLAKILLLLFADLSPRDRWCCAALAFAVGVSAVGPVSMLGSTIDEWQGAMLLTIALWLILRRAEQPAIGWRTLAAAGMLSGIASGLKLTAATYALGLCVALLLRSSVRRGWRDALGFGIAAVGGIALAAGHWMWTLYAHFGSPLFPYFNEFFRSPWWDFKPAIERTFGPHTLYEWLTFPLRLFQSESGFVAELEFRDWRLPLLYVVLLASLIAWAVRRLRGSRARPSAQAWRILFVYWLVSFVVWAALHSIYRYLLPLELLFGALTIQLLRSMFPVRWISVAALAYAALAIVTVEYPDWWHVPYGKRYFTVDVPPVAPHAVVLLVSDTPMAYVLPFFPPDGRFLGAKSNLNDPGRTNLLEREIARIVRDHDGPLYSLAFPVGAGADVLAAHRLRIDLPARDCVAFKTNMATSPLQLCRVQRIR